MINNVVKSNGRVVPFNPNKLNRWAEFADNQGISWSNLSLQAYRKCGDMCSTKDLQDAMIKSCVEMKTPESLIVGGRILLGNIYKDAFGGFKNIPTLVDFYKNMVESGLWEKMDYDWSELALLNLVINHSRDLEYNYTSLNQMVEKYLVKDRVNNLVKESPQFMFMGMAMANMERMPKERRMEDITKLYTYLSKMYINAPTPMLNHMRTHHKGYASCCVYTTNDTAESLATGDHIAYMMTCNSAGIGGFIKTRSRGDGIRNNTIEHMGKLPYLRSVKGAVHANTQGGRGGAATMYACALDPEIEDLLVLKNVKTVTEKQIRGIDYGFAVNRLLAQKVAKNEKWMLISYQKAPDLWEKFYSSDREGFKELYEAYEQDESVPKKFINARDLVIKFMSEYVSTGTIYPFVADEVNYHTPFNETIYSSNLCVAPETEVLTDKGYIIISELKDESVNVWNGKRFTNTVVRKTGVNKKLIKVITDSGYELECTPYHKWYIFDGYGKPYKEVKTHELKAGDKLAKFNLPVIEGIKELEKAYINGFYSGDGCFTKEGQRIYLYQDKRNLANLFEGGSNWLVQDDYDRQYKHYHDLEDKFFVPNSEYTIESRVKWLAGISDSDGCVYRNGNNEQLIINSINKGFLQSIQMMLQTLSVSAKVKLSTEAGYRKLPANDGTGELKDFWCQEGYRLIISSNDLQKLLNLGFKTNRLVITGYEPQRDAKQFVKVESIIDEGRYDDTYCFTETERGMGMFNGILTGQCAEIALPTKGFKNVVDLYSEDSEGEIGLCSLASYVLGRVPDELVEDVLYYTALMIDNVIDIMHYPFASLEATAKARRSIGVGVTNLAYDLASRGLTYDSKEGLTHIHRVMERHSYFLYKASLRLAKERGVCDWMHKTKIAEGWLPIDTANKNIDNLCDTTLQYDWESLRQEIKEVGGIRNSTLVAIMPVESSSQLTNTTNSVYPIRNKMLVKTSGNTKNYFIVPGATDPNVKYQYAWDVETKALMNCYGVCQKFTCQAISADTYVKFDSTDPNAVRQIPTSKLLTDFLHMFKVGLKTLYYCNSAAGVDLDEPEEIEESGCAGGGCKL